MKGLFELAYYLGYRLDKRRKSKSAKSLPARVISVGNLTTGGTGKTSLVIALAGFLKDKGYRAAVLTRGYKGSLPGPALITPQMSAREAGDEPLMMASRLQGIPVIKGADRYEAGLYAGTLARLSNGGPPGLFILDDGFQHWRLKRDLDILLLSATDPFYLEKLIPVGSLREPLSAMKRADIIVVSKTREIPDAYEKEIRKYNAHALIYPAWYEADGVACCATGAAFPVDSLRGKEVFAFAGIGEPYSFRQSLMETGAVIKGFMEFRDHHMFSRADIGRIKKKAHGLWIITTEKDIMRLGDACSGEDGLYSLSVKMRAGDGFYDEVLKKAGI
ncbi:MAG: tetraacyldisaccharide 4'-kinase [Nitrospiraceae bacterium]|nr:tetraacyldisaccharide 4'-kinase [Nitrospiraceae bacterium]